MLCNGFGRVRRTRLSSLAAPESEARVEKSYLPARPSASILYGSLFWQKRIGELLAAGEDKWWLLRDGQDATVVGDEVLVAIRAFALPAMRDQITST